MENLILLRISCTAAKASHDHLLCRPGLNVEVVDKNRIAQMRVATVTEVVGKRLHLKYHGAPPDDNGKLFL